MRNVLLLGASGTAGSALTKKLLTDTDYHLTLFSRHAGEMYTDTDRISVINGDAAKGYITPLPALVKFAVQLIADDALYSRESVSITQDAAKVMS